MEDKLEKSLKELLINVNVVVLPGFGAFVATDIPAMVDSKNNVIYPPRRVVNYNPDNTADDGVLTSQYSRQERISKDTAKEHLNQFVEEVNHRLQRGNPWIIEDLGKFIIDGLDRLNFFPDPDQNFIPQSYGLPEIELSGAKASYPIIDEPAGFQKEEQKHKDKKDKPHKHKKKRSKAWLVILLLLLSLSAGAFAFLTQTDPGKKIAEDIKHKVDGLLAKKEAKEEPKVEEPAVATDSSLVASTDTTDQVADPIEKEVETSATDAYQPREAATTFDTPDRLDIEPTKLDKFVKDSDGKKPEETVAKVEKPVVVKPAAVKPAPAKTAPAKTVAAAPIKKTPVTKPAVAEPKPTPQPTPRYNKADEEPVVKNVRPFRSNESIYSKYQIVANEYSSIDAAVENSDKYNKMGFNVAVIQFKNGKFGVCLARTNDKDRADRMLAEIGSQIGSARIKEY